MDAIVLHHILRALDFHPVEANLRRSFRELAAGRPGGDVIEAHGVAVASLGVAFQMFNATFLSEPVALQDDLEKRLGFARAHFESRGLAWAFWVCEDWLAPALRKRFTQTCERFGLRLSSEMPGMVAPKLAAPKRSLPEIDVRRVDSGKTLDDFRSIGSLCFHVPPAWFSEVFHAGLAEAHPGFVCRVGYHEGAPVCTAATVTGDGAIGLYNVATPPVFRRTGFGEAIARHAIAAATERSGPLPLVLQATSWGVRLYERMGFRPVTRILVYNSVD